MIAILRWIVKICVVAFACIGVLAVILAVMLSRPLDDPPEMTSIIQSARKIDQSGAAPLTSLQARDGSHLSYRRYQPSAPSDSYVVLIHGSSSNSLNMTELAQDFAKAGFIAITPDIRGHGFSGGRGDIGYIGQLEDDLEDLIAALSKDAPTARFRLIGFSSGGGFALRAASGRLSAHFDKTVLGAPFLGAFSPATIQKPKEQWAYPDIPRLLAIMTLDRLGLPIAQGLPVIAFATRKNSEKFVTPVYSFRLLSNFGPPQDIHAAFDAVRGKIEIFAGDQDQLFDSSKYSQASGGVKTTILPGLDHIGLIRDPQARAKMVAALAEP